MEASNTIQTVIWAIDPFMKEKTLQRTAGKALKSLLGAAQAKIEPVFVFDTSPLYVPVALSAEITARSIDAAVTGAEAILHGTGFRSLQPFKILNNPSSGLQGKASALLRYAKERKADLIVLSTRGRRGLSRCLIGSFAETVMLASPIPLLIVNPRWKTQGSFRNVLFPTDFSTESRHAFDRVLKSIRKLGGKVTLYHHLPNLVGTEVARTLRTMPACRDMVEKILSDRQKIADQWVAAAKKAGVKASSVIDHKTTGSDAEAILKVLRQKPALVAMAARSGKVASLILGSTTRQVLRGATMPVWVVHESKGARNQQQAHPWPDLCSLASQEEVHCGPVPGGFRLV